MDSQCFPSGWFLTLTMIGFLLPGTIRAQLAGDPVDVSEDFQKLEQVYFVGSRVVKFDPHTGTGVLEWERYRRTPTLSFNKLDVPYVRAASNEFPGTEYQRDPALPFSISFVSPRTVRLRFASRNQPLRDRPSPMIDGVLPGDDSWTVEETDSTVTYTSAHGQVRLIEDPWHVALYDEHGKLTGLLEQGVGAIKVDFGENAPLHGVHTSGRTGYYKHNLYPLRYNKVVSDLTKATTGERIIWERSAWAGSQRYPVHSGGDAENTNSAMAATLRAGLSFGLSGFTYWSHDVGGFVEAPSRDLYRRWLGFGVLTSHTRTHGAPPREPWAYGESFTDIFRRTIGLKYALMPYFYAQAKHSSAHGYPMVRALFFEYPDDPTSWFIEDEYARRPPAR